LSNLAFRSPQKENWKSREKDETSTKKLDEENPPQCNHRFLNSRQRVKVISMNDSGE
jgi:hypothetical protein